MYCLHACTMYCACGYYTKIYFMHSSFGVAGHSSICTAQPHTLRAYIHACQFIGCTNESFFVVVECNLIDIHVICCLELETVSRKHIVAL